jgi:hypothetical protein
MGNGVFLLAVAFGLLEYFFEAVAVFLHVSVSVGIRYSFRKAYRGVCGGRTSDTGDRLYRLP